MSSITIDIPTFRVNGKDLQKLINFIYKHRNSLKEFGVIKIQLNDDCKLALKKRRNNVETHPTNVHFLKIWQHESIYSVQKRDRIDIFPQPPQKIDERSFWSSLSDSNNGYRPVNSSVILGKTFFSQKTSRLFFDINRLPNESLLKIGGKKATGKCLPCLQRAYRPGAIFPLNCAQQHLFSINYHHEGGAHYWYIIPSRERNALQRIMVGEHSNTCLDHGNIFVNPSVFDKNHIRYHRVIQYPNEFIVLSAGTLTQSFSEDANWRESITFALPSWIDEGYANVPVSLCQCNILEECVPEVIDVNLFRHELIQRYVALHLNTTDEEAELPSSKGRLIYLEEQFPLFHVSRPH